MSVLGAVAALAPGVAAAITLGVSTTAGATTGDTGLTIIDMRALADAASPQKAQDAAAIPKGALAALEGAAVSPLKAAAKDPGPRRAQLWTANDQTLPPAPGPPGPVHVTEFSQ